MNWPNVPWSVRLYVRPVTTSEESLRRDVHRAADVRLLEERLQDVIERAHVARIDRH